MNESERTARGITDDNSLRANWQSHRRRFRQEVSTHAQSIEHNSFNGEPQA